MDHRRRVPWYLLAVVFAAGSFAFLPRLARAQAPPPEPAPVTGWAWSSTVGWISMASSNCDALNAAQPRQPPCSSGFDYGVVVDPTGRMSGHAWSRTARWICVGVTCEGSGGATPAGGWQARIDAMTGEVNGWGKALALGDRGWISFTCENGATCDAAAYRTTVQLANGAFTGHGWSGARVGSAIGWIAWDRILAGIGGVTTAWRPIPLCSRSGAACTTDAECELLGEFCWPGGQPSGRCGGEGAACGSSQDCAEGVRCCAEGVDCGRCTDTGDACGADADCPSAARDVCCPPDAVCAGVPPPPLEDRDGDGQLDGIDTDGDGIADAPDRNGDGVADAVPPTAVIGVCAAATTLCVEDDQCGGGECRLDRRICESTPVANACTEETECGGGVCSVAVGICDGPVAQACVTDVQCPGDVPCRKAIGKCTDAAQLCVADEQCGERGGACGKLFLPWVQTQYGSVYSRGSVGSAQTPPPPAGQYSATYCIIAGGRIVNFTSASRECGVRPQGSGGLQLPQAPTYQSASGAIDLAGLRRGRYGRVEVLASGVGRAEIAGDRRLDGVVALVERADLEVFDRGVTFLNASQNASGAGTFVVIGGDLRIRGNAQYQRGPVDRTRNLASVGWIVLTGKDALGRDVGGDIIIDPDVTELVGAFYAEGRIRTGTTRSAAQDVPLVVRGLLVARQLFFQRLAVTADGAPAEQIIDDGRALANPPPGFADLAKSLPSIRPAIP